MALDQRMADKLAQHVIEGLVALVLRAKQDDFGALTDFDGVTRRPVKQVASADLLRKRGHEGRVREI
jgi:hypothetical protein